MQAIQVYAKTKVVNFLGKKEKKAQRPLSKACYKTCEKNA